MINELHMLSEAMQKADVATTGWHREYLSIPLIRKDAPCFRLVLDGESVPLIESVAAESGQIIRKFGNKQGSYPAMNLAPLYRIPDDESKVGKTIQDAIRTGTVNLDLSQVRQWCVVNNWDEKFQKKYRICMIERPKRLKELLQGDASFEPLTILMDATRAFEDPQKLHRALEKTCVRMLEEQRNSVLALQMLFFTGNGTGNLSVVLDSFRLEDEGYPTIGERFTRGLNAALLKVEQVAGEGRKASETDAFGQPFTPPREPMPTVKLPAGWEVSLRTMFDGEPSQYRYQRINDDSYPISLENRSKLKAALEWISSEERKNNTWINTGSGEALFVYPSRLWDMSQSFTSVFSRDRNTQALFTAEAKRFAEHMRKPKKRDPEYWPDRIQLVYLRKLDKARSKVVYTRSTSPQKIVEQSDCWVAASENLPAFHFGQPETPFPLDIMAILNRVWKLDGSLASDKFRAVKMYHGLELFFDTSGKLAKHDLQMLVRNSENLAAYAGRCLCDPKQILPLRAMQCLKENLVLMGMLLYWTGSGKDSYMNEFPYWFGQLLKASDSLHELYCVNVRDGQIPPQLVGGSMYAAAAEFPLRTLAQLGQRMMPYLNWARTNRDTRKKNDPEGKEGPGAGYYLYIYEQIANKLNLVLTEQTRFTDAEKAQLFIGYLASFPKSEKSIPSNNIDEGESNHV